jgi:pyruvate/2-oxoglutarate dehydrogenase complex dihydrolipoamide dehydrogenase (E3) component
LAQVFARFGSQVFLLGNRGQILPREDQDATKFVEKEMVGDGVNLILNCKVGQVEKRGSEKVLHLDCTGAHSELRVDEILIAVGRTPNVEGLNLEAAGVEYDAKEGVHVNDRLQTSNPRIFAAGDICSRYKFTHAADAMARIVIQNALFFGHAKASALTIPWCTYTDPEIAHVGLYEREAKEQGIAVQTLVQELQHVDRAVLDGETDGFLKVHVKEGSDKILGATLVARHAGDMISEVTMAMTNGLGLKSLARTIHPYPTQAEAIKKIADSYNRTRLTPYMKVLLRKWLKWTQPI